MQIILHIGQQKTASTTIQAFLAQNREQLAAQGILYPRALGEKKAALLGNVFRDDVGLDAATKEKLLSALHKEISVGYDKVLISNENMFNSDFQSYLKEIFAQYATSWRILCYVRRPDEHMISNYQQLIKGPNIFTFDRFFELYLENGYYRYAEVIDKWADVFGSSSVEVRVFHRKTLQGGAIDDFTQWVGLDTKALSVDAEERVNESLDRVSTEVLRLLHIGLVEQPALMQRHDLRQINERLRSLDTGERVRLDTTRAKLLHEMIRPDHARLAERYLSPSHADVLLAPPAELPPNPPLDRDALAGRITRLFNDPDLVQFALKRAEKPASQDTIPRELIARPRSEVAASVLDQFARDGVQQAGGEARGSENDSNNVLRKRGSLLAALIALFRRG